MILDPGSSFVALSGSWLGLLGSWLWSEPGSGLQDRISSSGLGSKNRVPGSRSDLSSKLGPYPVLSVVSHARRSRRSADYEIVVRLGR